MVLQGEWALSLRGMGSVLEGVGIILGGMGAILGPMYIISPGTPASCSALLVSLVLDVSTLSLCA